MLFAEAQDEQAQKQEDDDSDADAQRNQGVVKVRLLERRAEREVRRRTQDVPHSRQDADDEKRSNGKE